jgi:VIT1/CCC1 family predicted Fe2+/Mn2+ transporter
MAKFSLVTEDYLRSALFGINDALVSTTGVVVGIAMSGANTQFILTAAMITISVEALSMGAGQFLSERAVHQIDKSHKDNLIVGSLIMFFGYFLSGLIPVVPVLIFDNFLGIGLSIMFAIIALFIVGFIKGKFIKIQPVRSGIEMMAIGGVATLVGALVGIILKI